MSKHATYWMLLVGKWDVSWFKGWLVIMLGRAGFLMPSHIIPKNNSSVWHSLLQVVPVVHLWKIQNKIQEMLENLHRCDHVASVPYPNECSQPNRNLRQGADWRFRDLGQGHSEASTKIPINDDDLWWFMIYNDLSMQQKSRKQEVLRNTCHLDVTIVAWPLQRLIISYHL